MENYKYIKEDYLELESYKTVVDSIADFLGESCEVMLCSFEDTKHPILHIANGNITNREVGSSSVDIQLKIDIDSKNTDVKKYFKTYFTESPAGKCIKSNQTAIRNRQGKIIGMICINWYLELSFFSMIKSFIPTRDYIRKGRDKFGLKSDNIIQEAINAAITGLDKDDIGVSAYNKSIIRNLYLQGIFDFKEAVQVVANYLDISHHTVYLHLRTMKNKKIKK